jgi:hypothetical protein
MSPGQGLQRRTVSTEKGNKVLFLRQKEAKRHLLCVWLCRSVRLKVRKTGVLSVSVLNVKRG